MKALLFCLQKQILLFTICSVVFLWSIPKGLACTLTCPSDILVNTDPSLCDAVVTYSVTITDPGTCLSTPNLVGGLASGSTFPLGSTLITYSGTDNNEEDISCSFTVTVIDNDGPNITCPGNISVSNDPDQCEAAIVVPLPSANDNCGVIASITNDFNGTADASDVYPIGTTVVSWEATDNEGNTSDCQMTVNVNDTESPTFPACPANITATATDGNCTAVVNWPVPTITDNCPNLAITDSHAPGESFPLGTTTVTYVATDEAGNSDNCQFSITVEGGTPASISCPADITTANDPGECSALVTYTVPFEVGCSGSGTLNQVTGLASGALFPIGTTVNSFELVDDGNVVASCSFSVIVTGGTPTSIACPANITAVNDADECGAVLDYNVSFEPGCSAAASLNQFTGLASGTLFPIGVTTNSFELVNDGDVLASCSFTVTVTDAESPSITACPSDITQSVVPGNCATTLNWSVPTITDNCPNLVITNSHEPGESFPIGTTTVTYVATDETGNSDDCQFSITVVGGEAATISCPANITAVNNAGECGAALGYNVTFDLGCNTGADLNQLTGLTSGSLFPVGTTTNSFELVENGSVLTSCSFTVTVTDAESPSIVACPSDITQSVIPGNCTATLNWPVPTITDNCPNLAIDSSHEPGEIFPLGTTTVTYVATDEAGNSDDCQFSVRVVGGEVATISCPNNITAANAAGECGAVLAYNLSFDLGCNTGAELNQLAGLSSGTLFPVGTTTNSFELVEDGEVLTSCSFTVTVTDTESPSIAACPSDITQAVTPGNCTATLNWPVPTITDNCPNLTITSSHEPGEIFPLGTTTVTYVATDEAGNSDDCQFSVRVFGGAVATIACPANLTAVNDAGECGAVLAYNVSFDLGCNTGADLNQLAGLSSGTLFPVGTTTNSFELVEDGEVLVSCSFTVTVTDTESPIIEACPSDITQAVIPGSCATTLNWPVPTITDNCANLDITNSHEPGAVFLQGTTTVTYVATDEAGNSDNCQFSVRVFGGEAATIACPANLTAVNDAGECGAVLAYNVSFDLGCNTGTELNQLAGLSSGTLFPVGTTTNSFELVEDGEVLTSCNFTVTVTDTESPIIAACPSDITQAVVPGDCMATVNWPAPTITDNCANLAITNSHESGESFPLGTTMVTYMATDEAGNSDNCQFSVRIFGGEVATIACPNNMTAVNDAGECGAVLAYNISFDLGCNTGAELNQLTGLSSGTLFPVGTTTNSFELVENEEVLSSCIFTVRVTDTESPTIAACPSDITQAVVPGNCTAPVSWSVPTITDNCANLDLFNNHEPGESFPLGTTTVTYIATDEAGNSDNCQFSVRVVGGEAATISCPDNISTVSDPNECGAVLDYSVSFESGCGTTSNLNQIAGLSSGTLFPVGTTTNSFELVNNGDVLANCSFTVNVLSSGRIVQIDTVICTGQVVNIGSESFAQSGDYEIAFEVSDGCDSIVQLNLEVIEPTLSSVPISICQGDSVLVAGLFRKEAGIYLDTIQSSLNCDSLIIQTDLAVVTAQNIEISGPNTLCAESSITLSATAVDAFDNYIWLPGNETTPDLEVTVPGRYELQATDRNGCTSVGTFEVTENCGLITADFEVSQDTACVSYFVEFTNNSSIEATTWLWDFGNGNFSEEANPFTIYPEPGDYTVTLVSSNDLAIDTAFRTIHVYERVEADFNAAAVDPCRPNNQVFENTSRSIHEVVSWKWNLGDGSVSTQAAPNHTYTNFDTVNVTLVMQDRFSCIDSLNQDVIIENLLNPIQEVAQANEDLSFCNQPEVVNLSAVAVQHPNLRGRWSQPEVQAMAGVEILDPASPTTSIRGMSSNNSYTFTWTLMNNICGDLSSDEVIVSLSDDLLQPADAGDDASLCEDDVIGLSANLPAGTTGEWTALSTNANAFIETPFDPVSNFADLNPGPNGFIWTLSAPNCPTYSADTIIVFQSGGLQAYPDVYLNVGQPLTNLNFLANDNIPVESEVSLRLLSTPLFGSLTANGDKTYNFTFGVDTTENIAFTYQVCLKECPEICDEAEVRIVSQPPPTSPPPIQAPANVITPNDDGIGERFQIPNYEEIPSPIQITVVNRWGDIVFRNSNYDNNWDGHSTQGNPLPEGTYFYLIRGAGSEIRGDITIIR